MPLVKSTQPELACAFGVFFSTVRTLLSSRTPCFAQCSRLPLWAGEIAKSDSNSWYIFLSEGGIFMPLGTEKLNPCACPSPW